MLNKQASKYDYIIVHPKPAGVVNLSHSPTLPPPVTAKHQVAPVCSPLENLSIAYADRKRISKGTAAW